MGLSRVLALLPLVAPLVQAQTNDTAVEAISANATATNATVEDTDTGTAPSYTPEECSYWLDTLVTSDADASEGLSEAEYHAFLSSIDDPPYIAEYFQNYEGFNELPWVFRVVHKSLSCHCEKLGYGAECCEGDDAEVLTVGLDKREEGGATSVEEEYQDLVCQQISYVLSRSVPSPAPTKSPSESPTDPPSGSPTVKPTMAPVTPSPTLPPVAPATPTPSVSLQPSAGLVIDPVRSVPEEPTDDGGLSTGAIVGIILALLALLLAIIALVIYRRKLEQDRLKDFAGEQVPEEDLEAPPAAEEGAAPQPEPEANDEPEPEPEPDEDDESSAPSVWSGSEADQETGAEMLDEDDGPGMTVGSSLAAMGAASTVAANIMSPGASNQKGSDAPGSSGGVFS